MRPLPLALLAAGLLAAPPAGAADPRPGELLLDPGFDAWSPGTPGAWEMRHAQAGDEEEPVVPRWRAVPAEDGRAERRRRHLRFEKEGASCGEVVLGQRVVLPDPPRPLDLSVELQASCAERLRSGILRLSVRSERQWDGLARSPEEADGPAPEGDLIDFELRGQGDDLETWERFVAPRGPLRAVLREHAGERVVVSLSFVTWHPEADEWARVDEFRLGPPWPRLEAVQWPNTMPRGRELVLRAVGTTAAPGASCVLRHRPAGSEEPWAELPAVEHAPGEWWARLPAERTRTALEVQARLLAPGEEPLASEVRTLQPSDPVEHPGVFRDAEDLRVMKDKAERHDWARAAFEEVRRHADDWMSRPFEPLVRSGGWWHEATCPACGSHLDSLGPREHRCPGCGRTEVDPSLESLWWAELHRRHARAARDLALVASITGERAYALRAIEILAWYAEHYDEFPGGDKGGRVLSQTLDEVVWLLEVIEAADLVHPHLSEEQALRIDRDLVLAGVRHAMDGYPMKSIHNITCWHVACWAAAGRYLGDPNLVREAIDGPRGLVAQLERGVLPSGMWRERSMGYHAYATRAIVRGLHAMRHSGRRLHERPEVARLLTFPTRIAFPDLSLPALNDGPYEARPLDPAPLELAWAWHGDREALRALRQLQAQGLPRASLTAWEFGEPLPEVAPAPPRRSENLPAAGLAILRRGDGSEATWAYLEHGEHGGMHGHPDSLQLLLYGLGRPLVQDLGATGYSNASHLGYYKTTLGHSTVTVGGEDLAPESAELLALVDGEAGSAAVARNVAGYPGRTLLRRLFLADDLLVDEFVVEGGELDSLEWTLRCEGRLDLDLDARPLRDRPLSPAHAFLHGLRGAMTAEDWTATWSLPDSPLGERVAEGLAAPRLSVTLRGEPGTRVVAARAPGPSGLGVDWDTLLVRRHGKGTRFVAVHQLLESGVEPREVEFAGRLVRVGGLTVDLGSEDEEPPRAR